MSTLSKIAGGLSELNQATGRSATYVVAASDAPAHVKAQADYVFTGNVAADTAVLQDYIDNANGNTIQLIGNTFPIAGPLTIQNAILRGSYPQGLNWDNTRPVGKYYDYELEAGTILQITNDVPIGIQIYRPGRLEDVMVYQPAANLGIAIQVGGAAAADYQSDTFNVLNNVRVYSPYSAVATDVFGTAVRIEYASGCSWRNVACFNFDTGIHIFTQNYHINSSNFFGSSFRQVKTPIKLEVTGTGEITGNNFYGVAIQPLTGMGYGIECISSGLGIGVTFNRFYGVYMWDWLDTYPDGVSLSAGCIGNYFDGYLPIHTVTNHVRVTDAGSQNKYGNVNLNRSIQLRVAADGGDFSKLSDAMLAAATCNDAGGRVELHVYGPITDDGKLEPSAYVDVIGHDAVITSTYDGGHVISGGVTNFLWDSIKIISTGQAANIWCLYLDNTGGKFKNCEFEVLSDVNSTGCVYVHHTTTTIFENCTFKKTGAGTGTLLAGAPAGSNVTAEFNKCHFISNDIASSNGISLGALAKIRFIDCFVEGVYYTINPFTITAHHGCEIINCYTKQARPVLYTSVLFDAAGLTDSTILLNHYPQTVCVNAWIRLDEQFAAPGMTDLYVTLGDVGDPDGYAERDSANMISDAVGTCYRVKGAYLQSAGYYYHALHNIYGYSTSVGANLNTLTAGKFTCFVYCRVDN